MGMHIPRICCLYLCAGLCIGLGAPTIAHGDGPASGPPQPIPVSDSECDEPGSTTNAWIDKVQKGVYDRVCGAALWFDGLFGNPRYDQDSDATYGRLGLFEYYDRRDQFDTRLRLRARVALPALKDRLRLTLNRDNEQEEVEERPGDGENPVPQSFRTVDDESWLLGLGYSLRSGLDNGFDFGVGVRIRSPLDPYVKASYQHTWVFNRATALRFRETPFWRDSRGFGATTQVSLDYLLKENVLFRWNNVGTAAEDTEGLDWGTSVSAYQDLRRRAAISYTALLRGETGADVPIKNYGVEVRYRRQVFRKWLFLDLSSSLTWPRETLLEKREINPGVGVGLEMYFGPVPDLEMR